MDTEEYFPRGQLQNAPKISHTNFAFGNGSKRGTNWEDGRSRKRARLQDTPVDFLQELNYGTIEEGMTILGCVRSVTELTMEVELPGRMSGKIAITSISSRFTEHLRRKPTVDNSRWLAERFRVGQFLPTKVLSKRTTEKGTKIVLSTNPSDLHHSWSCDTFTKGRVIWATVEGREDHGYGLTVGNGNCRIFLPDKSVSSGVSYEIGQPMWCKIKKLTASDDLITLIVKPLVDGKKLDENVEPVNLIPGTPVNFTVTQIGGLGLMGTFLKHTNGYIHEAYLRSPSDSLSDYSIGDNLRAYFLYNHPVTKHSYFSLRPLQCTASRSHENGVVLPCQFKKRTKGGVMLQLPDNSVGLVVRKRLNILSLDDCPPKCRILDYRHLEQLYICSFETEMKAKEEDKPLEIGQSVSGPIRSVTRQGIVVQLGKITGFIQNIHLLDEPYSEEARGQFKVGNLISAKVWNVKETGVYLTCKKMMLEMEMVPVSLDDVSIKAQYPGVVVKKSGKGILVIFAGDVRGMLFRNYLCEIFGSKADDAFYEGEVVIPVVDKVENGMLSLKLNLPDVKVPVTRPLTVGEYVSTIVSKIAPEGLYVTVPWHRTNGLIPTSHLGCNISLTPSLLKTYKIGDQLDYVMCVCNGPRIFSLREGRRFKLRRARVPTLGELKVGSLLRCSYLKTHDNRINVSALIAPKGIVLSLYNNDFDVGSNRRFLNEEAIVAKITRLGNNGKQIKITAKTNEVYDWSLKEDTYELEQYLSDVQRIRKDWELGQRIEGVVKSIKKDYTTLSLEGGGEGIVMKHDCLDSMKNGDKVQGVVLWVDVQRSLAIVSLQLDALNFQYDSDIKRKQKASILYFNDDLVMTVTKNNDVIFIPNLSNRKFLNVSPYRLTQKVTVLIKRLTDGMAIGVDEDILQRFQKQGRTTITTKTKYSKDINEENGVISEEEDDEKSSEEDLNEQQSPSHENEEASAEESASEENGAPNEDESTSEENGEPDAEENGEANNEESTSDEDEPIKGNEPLPIEKRAPTLPGVQDFFSKPRLVESEGSSDDEKRHEPKTKKKKKETDSCRTYRSDPTDRGEDTCQRNRTGRFGVGSRKRRTFRTACCW